MLRIAICDDNNFVCNEIEEFLLDYKKSKSCEIDTEVFWTGETLFAFITKEHEFDLIFLDIEIGSMTGIEVGTKIREELDDYISKIVFITSKDGYEKQLFDVQPLNFLKKPISREKVNKILDLTIKLLGIDHKMFEYKIGRTIFRHHVKDIIYFERQGKRVKIVTTAGEDYFYDSLIAVGERLPENFIEPHASFLINFHKIIKLSKDYVVMSGGVEIPVSQRNLRKMRMMLIETERGKNSDNI